MISPQNVPTIVPRPRASSRVQRPLRRLLDDGERRHRGDGQHRDSRRDGSFVFFFLLLLLFSSLAPRGLVVVPAHRHHHPSLLVVVERTKMTTTFTLRRRRRRQRKRVLDIGLSSLLLQRCPVRRVRGARCISSPHLLIDNETLRYTHYACVLYRYSSLHTPRFFLCLFEGRKRGGHIFSRKKNEKRGLNNTCLLYTSPSPRDA